MCRDNIGMLFLCSLQRPSKVEEVEITNCPTMPECDAVMQWRQNM